MHTIDLQVLSQDEQMPLTLQQIKSYARISYNYDDELLMHLLRASVRYVERVTSLSLTKKKVLARVENPGQIVNLRWSINAIERVEYDENCDVVTLKHQKDYTWSNNKVFFLVLPRFKGLALQLRVFYNTLHHQPDAYLAYWIMHHTALMYDKNPSVMQFEEQMRDFYQAHEGVKL